MIAQPKDTSAGQYYASGLPGSNGTPVQGPHYTTFGMGRNAWVRVSRSKPCPVCGKPDNCTVSPDGGAVWCGRVDAGSKRTNAGGQHLHILRDDVFQPPVPIPTVVERKPDQDFTWPAKRYFRDAGNKRAELAGILGVTVESLTELRVGWSDGGGWWSVPMRDAAGRVIGISRRWPDGSKRTKTGSRNGLFYASEWDAGDGPIVLPEGGSDTAALMSMGLNAVGRPSNLAGAELLAELLAEVPAERTILVLGENDLKPDGTWPGRSGAKATAERLAVELNRPVAWALPGDGSKDARAWLKEYHDLASFAELGELFLAGLVIDVVSPPDIREPDLSGPVVSLEAYRADLVARRRAFATKPGVYLDTSPTGSGKSHADREAIRLVERSLVILPTHDNIAEAVAELRKDGIEAVAFPQRSPENCRNMTAADNAERLGLPIQRTVCLTCPFRRMCDERGGYLHEVTLAGASEVTLATHARGASMGLNALAAGRQYVAVHEDATNLLRPTCKADAADLVQAGLVFDELLNNPNSLGTAGQKERRVELDEEQWVSVRLLANLVEKLSERLEAAETTAAVPVGCFDVPTGVEWHLWKATLAAKAYGMGDGTWRLLLGTARGQADLTVVVDQKRGKGGVVRTDKRLMATWHHTPAAGACTVFSDATMKPADLAELVGGPVRNITPVGRLETRHKAIQLAADVTRQTSPERVLGSLRQVLADRPEIDAAGVICHSKHEAAIEELRKSDGEFGRRVKRVTYFGKGDERSSNAWHSECDAVIVLGTPRPGGDAVRERLVQTGKLEAAAVSVPEWEAFTYMAGTEAGGLVPVESRRYANADWQRAFEGLCSAELVQCIGRGRTLLASGIPVILVSTEWVGLPMSDGEHDQRLNSTLAAVLHQLKQPVENRAETPIESNIGKTARYLADLLGLKVRTVQAGLAELEKRGLVLKTGKARATRWRPVTPTHQDEPGTHSEPVDDQDIIPETTTFQGELCVLNKSWVLNSDRRELMAGGVLKVMDSLYSPPASVPLQRFQPGG